MKVFRRSLFISQYGKVVQWNLLVFHHFPVSKNVRDKRSFRETRLSVELFCLTVSKIFVGEPFCAVFQNFSGNEKVHVKEGRGVYEDFPPKSFCLTVRKVCSVESPSVSLFSGIEKC